MFSCAHPSPVSQTAALSFSVFVCKVVDFLLHSSGFFLHNCPSWALLMLPSSQFLPSLSVPVLCFFTSSSSHDFLPAFYPPAPHSLISLVCILLHFWVESSSLCAHLHASVLKSLIHVFLYLASFPLHDEQFLYSSCYKLPYSDHRHEYWSQLTLGFVQTSQRSISGDWQIKLFRVSSYGRI